MKGGGETCGAEQDEPLPPPGIFLEGLFCARHCTGLHCFFRPHFGWKKSAVSTPLSGSEPPAVCPWVTLAMPTRAQTRAERGHCILPTSQVSKLRREQQRPGLGSRS